MWFMNKIANPFVRLILRSPVHGLMSAAVLLITYRGRKTGQEYTLPAQYARDRNNIYIIPGYPEKKTWWHNLKNGMDVTLLLKGQILCGRGTLLERQADEDEMLNALSLYLQRFPSSAKIHNVRLGEGGRPNAEDLHHAIQSIKLVRVKLN